jgi:hypothetical protein
MPVSDILGEESLSIAYHNQDVIAVSKIIKDPGEAASLLQEALADLKKSLELDSNNAQARIAVHHRTITLMIATNGCGPFASGCILTSTP